MFSIFKKTRKLEKKESEFEVELTASILAYEIARSDGNITEDEKILLLKEVKKISHKVGKDKKDILLLIESYSNDSVSFYEFIEDINKFFSKEDKISLIRFLWDVAYADSNLDVDEERLIRRIAGLIKVRDIDVLKLKDRAKK
tara:strand:- start:2356 stop:2784 length:429 start_codon:yes stop_codon:yes gene_type:complete